MRHEQIAQTATYEAKELTKLPADIQGLEKPFWSAAAVPDVPAAVGRLLFAAYVALIGTFAITMAHTKDTLFAMAICGVFLTMYLAVPRIFLTVEPKQSDRPDLDTFLTNGLATYTGHCSGKDALVQMLIVPTLLTLCAFVMGVMALLVT